MIKVTDVIRSILYSRWYIPNFVLPFNLSATTLTTTFGQSQLPHGSNSTANKSRKRQEIIFLRDDSALKRNTQGETMANIERHGKSLSAEGKVFKGAPKANSYEDLSVYQGPAPKEQSVSKNKGPPEIQEHEKKSDAYEVVSYKDDTNHATSQSEDETPRIIKVGHHRRHHSNRVHESDDSDIFKGHHRSGLHIVSLNRDDNDENFLGDKDKRLYGSIGSPITPSFRRHKSHLGAQQRQSYYPNDYYPPSVVPVSQDDLTGRPPDEGQSRDEMFPSLRRRDPFTFSPSSQLTQAEELMQPSRPLISKAISVGDRPNTLLLPWYNGRSVSDATVVPMTAQNAFLPSQPQLGAAPIEYSSSPAPAAFNNGLLFQSALQVPLLQTQSVNPSSFDLPQQSAGQFLFNTQQPDVRSLYQLQAQPQVQIPQLQMSQFAQPQPLIIPAQVQMTSDMLSSSPQVSMGPSSRWVDEDGSERSEVLDRQRDRTDDNGSQDDRGEDDSDDDNGGDEGRQEKSSRYHDREDDSPREDEGDEELNQDQDYQSQRSYSRDEEGPSEEEGGDAEEPENEFNQDANGRSFERNDPESDDEESPDSRAPSDDDRDDEDITPQENPFSANRNHQHFDVQAMQRFMATNRGFNFPRLPMAPNLRYQLASHLSAPLPTQREPRPLSNILGNSDLKISQLSPAEAQYFENKAALEPNFAPPISSKDTIPRKSPTFRLGLGNVLIRLNGKPLEDSAQLRSKIINGQIIQGRGKMVKSKGPVRVKLSHTKDARRMKIIDIIAPEKFHVYDTKSMIRRPVNGTNETSKADTKLKSSFSVKALQKAMDNIT